VKIVLGADHGGFLLKGKINQFLKADGYQTVDYGVHSPEPCDYPLYAEKVARAISEGKADLGILICKSGNGMAIVANKFPNVRAAICFDKNVAVLSRQHNNANVLVLGSEHLFDEPELIVRSWLEACFEGGRHKRRVDQIARIEEETFVRKRTRPAAKAKKSKRK
jgi:ribose 5-phosphate isomerase B